MRDLQAELPPRQVQEMKQAEEALERLQVSRQRASSLTSRALGHTLKINGAFRLSACCESARSA